MDFHFRKCDVLPSQIDRGCFRVRVLVVAGRQHCVCSVRSLAGCDPWAGTFIERRARGAELKVDPELIFLWFQQFSILPLYYFVAW